MSAFFTSEQQSAIDAKGADILVSAAAGAGKTAVLVERVIRIITDNIKPVDIDRLLVVTFTEMAAGEMRKRVTKRLNELLILNPNDLNIRRQLALMPVSNIMTIHAFCRRLVKDHAGALGLDPRFKIGARAELIIIKQELMEALLEEEYSKEDNTGFTDLVEMYGDKYKDNSLRELIYKTYEFMFTSPWPYKRMDHYVGMYAAEKLADFDETPWARLIADMVKNVLPGAVFELERALAICYTENGPERYACVIDEDIADITGLTDILDNGLVSAWPAIAAFEFSAKRLPVYRKTGAADEELKNAAKKLRQNAKDAVKKLIKDYFNRPLDLYIQDLIAMEPVIKSLADITVKFARVYKAEKQERALLDFNDLEQFVIEVLYTGSSDITRLTLTDAAAEIRGLFDEIMIDEYQDSNLIQELILGAISGSSPRNRFMVGDIKQSIYRFRQAEPEIFIEKYNAFEAYTKNPDAPQVKINLSKNFRSKENIIDTINFLFFQLMSREVGEIDYNGDAALSYGANYPGGSDAVEVCLIENNMPEGVFEDDEAESVAELTKAETEARFLARKIKTIVTDGSQTVYDDKTGACRKAEYRDIVILTPSVKAVAAVFADEFKKCFVPLYINAEGEFFKTVEVATILSFLQIIDNPKQDIPLITVLHSPIYNINCDGLTEIKMLNQKALFYDCVLEYEALQNSGLREKISAFISDLQIFQDIAQNEPISELISKIYEHTRYLELSGAMSGGNMRQANLQALIGHALAFEGTRLKGLFHFLKYIEKLRLTKNDLPEARAVSQNEDVVRLMTIHASKGLEFPIVFLSCLHRGFGGRAAQSVLLDTNYGFGADYVDLEYRIKYNTLPKIALAYKQLKEDLSERLRVLYVAVTRAKEKLYLTGVVGDYARKREKWAFAAGLNDIKLPSHYMLKARNYLDFVMPAFLRRDTVNGLPYSRCDFEIHIEPPVLPPSNNDITDEPKPLALEADTNADIAERIRDAFNWRYAYKISENLSSMVTISELKRLYHTQLTGADNVPYYMAAPENKPPRFITQAGIKASDIGTAIHTVMEHIDLSRAQTADDIQEQILALTKMNLIEKDVAGLIPKHKIAKFFASPLYERIQKSPRVIREAPFVTAMKPREIYKGYDGLEEDILLHGVIDLYFEEDGCLVLVDYKSDYIPEGKTDGIIEKYAPQLKAYKKTLEESLGLNVKEVYLYLFYTDTAVLCTINI